MSCRQDLIIKFVNLVSFYYGELYAIAEEKDAYLCLEIKDVKIKDRAKAVFDGRKLDPLKPHHPDSNNQNKHPKMNRT